MQVLEGKIGKFLHDLGICKQFLTKTQNSDAIKDYKLDLIKLRIFCIAKSTIKVKRQLLNCEKVFVTHITDADLISPIKNF